jgi:N-acyl-D-aspartate/D-glutamate deacylase
LALCNCQVREKGLLSWSDALRKCTLGPAKRLEDFCPAMLKKGRLAAGMDADITVFDPQTIIDCATLAQPAMTSAGIAHVIVNGVFVVDNGVESGALPGRAVRGQSPMLSPSTTSQPTAARGTTTRKIRKTTELFSAMLEGQSTSFLQGFDC